MKESVFTSYRRWVWLVVPCVALLELGGALADGQWAPEPARWQDVVPVVRALKHDGDALVVAPHWAEPLARQVLGDRLWPIEDVARSSLRGAPRVVELSILGQSDAETRGWPIILRRQEGEFRFSIKKNPHYRPAHFEILEALVRGEGQVATGPRTQRQRCDFQRDVGVSTGGLHGHVAFPAERFVCGQREASFVGVTIIDDENYRPRRCVWAPPPSLGSLSLRFDDVPLGTVVDGSGGFSYFLTRGERDSGVRLEVFVDGRSIGTRRYRGPEGWQPFSFATARRAEARGRLELEVSALGANPAYFCFVAATR